MSTQGVGRSPGVEWPYIEAACSEENFLTYLFFTYEETTLVASRYIEGHALILCIYTVTVAKSNVRLLVNSNVPIAVIPLYYNVSSYFSGGACMHCVRLSSLLRRLKELG